MLSADGAVLAELLANCFLLELKAVGGEGLLPLVVILADGRSTINSGKNPFPMYSKRGIHKTPALAGDE